MQYLLNIICMTDFSMKTIYGDHNVYEPKFNLRPLDLQGWGENFPLYTRLINEIKPELIVEVGVWKGSSSIFMANQLKKMGKGKIVAVDTWLGAIEFWTKHIKGKNDNTRNLYLQNGYPSIYYNFLSNVVHKNVTDQVVPFPVPSLLAANFFTHKQIKAEIIHIDASHEYQDVKADLNAWEKNVKAGGIIFGDYYNSYCKGVVKAVYEFVAANPKRILVISGNKWIVKF